MFDLDAHFRLHAESLKLSSRRSELIARNLANAETPNYKARDLDFRKALATALGEGGGAVGMTATSAGHLGGSQSMNLDNLLIDRTPLIESLDGNTVDDILNFTACDAFIGTTTESRQIFADAKDMRYSLLSQYQQKLLF